MEVLTVPHNTHQRRRVHRSNQEKESAASRNSVVEASPQHPIRVFIADKHEVVRAGVHAFLQGEHDLEVVGEADNADAVLSESRRTKPEVVLLESELSGGSQSDICKRLFEALPSVRIVSLMRDNNDRAFLDAIEAGARGCLQKNVCRIELVRAVRTVAKGGSYLGPEGAEQTFRLLRQQQDGVHSRSRLHTLSLQERRVISLIAEGNTNKEIATKLVLSDKTVKNYIANLFVKLEVSRRTQAVARYLQTW
jgi:DNA-binding NarL/FixJ family response regulator